ncbi:hypothetical protein BC835DRAFT_1411223 [Cytidiella melzeri]|nr:hypothetical protein BC835DRAFT_1411223 [Cytidiella melzeri]
MPGPSRRKAKTKKSSGAGRDLSNVDIPTVLDAFIDEIDDASDWQAVVDLLCRMFNLPDLGNRSGLIKIHANFDDIQKNLESAYTKYSENEKVAGGIVGIWAAMCTDSILRNRLFQAGKCLVEKMLPLFDKRSTRYVGLQALTTVTHHGGSDVRREIASHTPTLLRLMEEFPDDYEVNELVVTTLAHTTTAVVNDDESPPTVRERNMRNLDIPAILRLVLRSARSPEASAPFLSHVLELLSSVCEPCCEEVKAIPSLVAILIASLRSKESAPESSVAAGDFVLFPDAVVDDGFLDPNQFLAAIQRRFPSELNDVMMAYGAPRCDTYIILQASVEFQRAMQRCVEDHDLYALGIKLSDLVLRTEYSITDGIYQAINARTGQPEVVDIGLPFQMWSDSLPHCSEALRRKGSPSDLDRADMLYCKFLIMRKRLPEALDLAKKASARSPQVSYFYYVIGLTAKEMSEGLRASKKGLKCAQTTPFVKHFLLWRATEHAAHMGLLKLGRCRPGDAEYSEGMAFLSSALEDAKTFISDASPDSRHMNGKLSWYILLTIAMRGPELSVDLRELDLPMKKLQLTHKFFEFFRTPLRRTQVRNTRELVLKKYKANYQEWQSLVERLDIAYSSGEDLHRSARKAGDNLAAWLEGLSVDDGQHDGLQKRTHAPLGLPSVELYRCSYCGNPSAVLRKCSGCGRTR